MTANTKPTKKAAASAARERGADRFLWTCKHHGETEHHSSNQQCVTCKAMDGKRRNQRRSADPQALESWNAYQRRYASNRRAKDPAYLGERRETFAALAWKAATGATDFPASYRSERQGLRQIYAECPRGHHVDHLVPKVAIDYGGKHVAVGLHCIANLQAVPQRLNLKKASFFDPDNFREQRPANAYPGGAWDPELTEREWSKVELLVRRYGEDRETSVRTLQADIARQYQVHLAALATSA